MVSKFIGLILLLIPALAGAGQVCISSGCESQNVAQCCLSCCGASGRCEGCSEIQKFSVHRGSEPEIKSPTNSSSATSSHQ